jgi:importin-9
MVLKDLVDECFSEVQFFPVAGDLVKVLYNVAVNDACKPVLRALAISVFRSCFDTLEMLMEDHKAAVKSFADESLNTSWNPFFMDLLKSKLPDPPTEEQENNNDQHAKSYRGLISLKLQVMKVLTVQRNHCPPYS